MPADVVDYLSEALGDDWAVERQTDYEGDVSIVVLPIVDPDGGPSFILFEQNGMTALARICMEQWGDARPFRSFRAAVDALIAEALAYSGCAWLEPVLETAAFDGPG